MFNINKKKPLNNFQSLYKAQNLEKYFINKIFQIKKK